MIDYCYYYPAVFTPEEEGGYSVHFPDLRGCLTEGDTVDEAIKMAFEALEGYLDVSLNKGKTLPLPTEPQKLITPKGGFVSIIPYNLTEKAAYGG
jgi:predicted RNase H-like HicB family nuclease